MSYVMTAAYLADMAQTIANSYKTLYVKGCFGAPLTEAAKIRYIAANSYNATAARKTKINSADSRTFGFDCVCLIKAILWGWCGNYGANYGGATYASNSVPDVDTEGMLNLCSDVKTEGWADMVPGEVVWLSGHIGIYIGDGKAVECTPSWEDKVQVTAVANIGKISGYNSRTWTKHGKLPFIDYSAVTTEKVNDEGDDDMTVEELSKKFAEMRKSLQDNDASDWSEDARKWAIEKGIVTGISASYENYAWQDFLTREELVTMLYRALK